MVQHQPLLSWILLLYINILMLKKKLEREGCITGLSEVTVMRCYLLERDFYNFFTIMFNSITYYSKQVEDDKGKLVNDAE